jgi:hypothetical protein
MGRAMVPYRWGFSSAPSKTTNSDFAGLDERQLAVPPRVTGDGPASDKGLSLRLRKASFSSRALFVHAQPSYSGVVH